MLNKKGLQLKKIFFLRSAYVIHVSRRGKNSNEKDEDTEETDAWSWHLKFSHVVICNNLSDAT